MTSGDVLWIALMSAFVLFSFVWSHWQWSRGRQPS